MNQKYKITILISILILIILALLVGPSGFPSAEIFFNIRLPRVLAGLIIGGALASSGSIMQGVLRNPLAEPYILGASSGALLGMIVSISLGIPYASVFYYLIIFLFSFFATILAYFISRGTGTTNIINLILAGVIVNIFVGAIILIFFFLSAKENFSVISFMMGQVSEKTFPVIITCAIIFILGFVPGLILSKQTDILMLGDKKATELGVNTEKVRIIMLLSSALMTSASVVLGGLIGFVGLIIPHIVRMFVGPLQRNVLVGSLFSGAVFLVLVDAFSRTILSTREIPVGIITALIGAPFFVGVLTRKRDYYL
mgnify:CR=1 FL=1